MCSFRALVSCLGILTLAGSASTCSYSLRTRHPVPPDAVEKGHAIVANGTGRSNSAEIAVGRAEEEIARKVESQIGEADEATPRYRAVEVKEVSCWWWPASVLTLGAFPACEAEISATVIDLEYVEPGLTKEQAIDRLRQATGVEIRVLKDPVEIRYDATTRAYQIDVLPEPTDPSAVPQRVFVDRQSGEILHSDPLEKR